MTDDTTTLIIKQLVEACDADVEMEDVTLDMSLREDLEMDSLAAVSFILDIESELDILVTEADVAKLQTVGDAVSAIKEKLSAQAS